MAIFLGVDTGGTYTDAAVLDNDANQVLGKAKSLTTRRDLALGIGRAVDAALNAAGVAPADVAMVSLSTTLATNALVEGQGGRVALVFIGFDDGDLDRGGLREALGSDPVIVLAGGHTHAGGEAVPLDIPGLEAALALHQVVAYGVAAKFATRNPGHEVAAREVIRRVTGRPVTCSHELSANLNGPKRALTAVLNARLVGMIDRLVTACEAHIAKRGINAPLMVVRGDGALISAAMVRDRPIETILSGPAASIVGARWLTGATDALVSDIGGTTTDVAMLRDGLPEIDPLGARVGGFRTMVEAVAMRTTGLGGDSEAHLITTGLNGGFTLGPRRLVPVALLAVDHGAMVHAALDRALSNDAVGEFDGRFVIPMGFEAAGLTAREAALLARITHPMPLADAMTSRLEVAAMDRLVSRGLVMISGVTPSDASHVLGGLSDWDATAARKAVTLLGRRRNGRGERVSGDAGALAQAIVDQLTEQTATCLLEAAFGEDARFAGQDSAVLAGHTLLRAGLDQHRGIVEVSARLGVPVIGLGASAPYYYGAVGRRLGAQMILPEHAGVANAIGAVVGQVSQRATGVVSSAGEGQFTAHLAYGPVRFTTKADAMEAMQAALIADATSRAQQAGADEVLVTTTQDVREAVVEGRAMFIEATLIATASGRPRVAHAAKVQTVGEMSISGTVYGAV
ncbi:N-methylhydantoinase A/oxoprolinase/acetone carboxylase, beta subunit [Pseudorhodobacter antarcticus]|uniref:N-methylhydantoinase A/oxoprolinase/acetone carboxylase, beta subunit n=1 Tax=Pseudorhodobacter antarcticus TaxID=1077947 RepID=A0A1H8CHQ4_9RHOB|nr:hydantoinase/oxoprolinase family protein [Pseudorhodobacter antarcticus]SEM94540.1 N-methylhydantoinase A/oxoprolinase/acetone carboxylase, beta subunit [Pseudorhodobacter antarcticus]